MSLAAPPAPPAGTLAAGASRRRELGAFYTPAHAVDHMVGLLRGVGPQSVVLEPSGGDGAFVAGLLRAHRLRPGQVHVADLDPAVAPRLAAYGVQFTVRDALLDPPHHPGGFTHVIGNPPYLSKASSYLREHRTALRRAYAEIGAHDTYAMFTLMGLRALAAGGQLVFLVSDTFLTLGVHRALRRVLLEQTTVERVTLLPRSTFPDAAVGTAVLAVTKAPPPPGHVVTVTDCRDRAAGDYAGVVHRVRQGELAALPAKEFAFDAAERALLAAAAACPPLLGACDGGLGMYTRDNARFLAVLADAGVPRTAAGALPVLEAATATAGPGWRAYHKRGGDRRWWGPAEHAVRWDEASRAGYGIPTTALAGAHPDGRARPGVVLSGISTRLAARLATPGALWESNKVFGLFPRDPAQLPPELLLALLNSASFTALARALNHTISLQARDLARLPLPPLAPAEAADLAAWAAAAVAGSRAGQAAPVATAQARIDAAVAAALARLG